MTHEDAPIHIQDAYDQTTVTTDEHADMAEQALLGAVLDRPERFAEAVSQFDRSDLAQPHHEAIWDAMTHIVSTGRLPDPMLVNEHLAKTGQLAHDRALRNAGAGSYLVDLVRAGQHGQIDEYARIVRERGQRRKARAILQRLLLTIDSTDNITDALEKAGELLDREGARFGATSVSRPDGKLKLETVAELRARVALMGPRRWMLKGAWPAGDYGVFAAPPKAQKTMTTVDLAVSVASGTPWLGLVDVETPGPVIMFAGEGGDRDIARRLTATATAKNVDLDSLPIHVCTRAPLIGQTADLDEMRHMVETIRPTLVTLDPLYLSAKGAELQDIYKMGDLLQGPQLICQATGASLWVVHHFNRQSGRGAERMAGAGPHEWARVLVPANVKSNRTDVATLASYVTTELEFKGGGIPDRKLRVERTVRAENPEDLDSQLHISTSASWVTSEAPDQETSPTNASEGDLKPSQVRLVRALEELGPATIPQMQAWMAQHDETAPLKRETCSRELNGLAARGLVDSTPGVKRFEPTIWLLADPRDPRDVTRDDHTDPSRVTRVTAPIGGHTSHGHRSHDNPQTQSHTSEPTLLDPEQPNGDHAA